MIVTKIISQYSKYCVVNLKEAQFLEPIAYPIESKNPIHEIPILPPSFMLKNSLPEDNKMYCCAHACVNKFSEDMMASKDFRQIAGNACTFSCSCCYCPKAEYLTLKSERIVSNILKYPQRRSICL